MIITPKDPFYIDKVLGRTGYHTMMAELGSNHSSVPSMQAHIRSDVFAADRLAQLRGLYGEFSCSARAHSYWNDALAAKIDISAFRRDSQYMWQHRDGNVPVTYLATYYFHLSSRDSDLLALCVEDTSFGVYSLVINDEVVSRDRLDSVAELGFLRKVLDLKRDSRARILDIGSGYGRLGWRISQCFPQLEVLCTDAVAESSFLCEGYLRYRGVPAHVRMVPLPEIESELSRRSVDLAIAINSLSECTADAVMWWLDLLARHRVPKILLVPHNAYSNGRTLLSHEASGQLGLPIEPLLEKLGYTTHTMEPKYADRQLQLYGVSPTHFHLFSRSDG